LELNLRLDRRQVKTKLRKTDGAQGDAVTRQV